MSLYYEGGTFLHRMNPVVKLGLATLALFHMVFFPDHAIALLHLLISATLLAYVRPRALPSRLLGVLGGIIVGHGLVNAILVRCGQPIIGGIPLTWEGLYFGSMLAARAGAILVYSIVFSATTSPRDLAVSLVRQLKVPYRYAYTFYVAYRLAPLVRRDLEELNQASRIMGIRPPRSPAARLKWVLTPLLSTLVKRSITLSLSMDSRAFGAKPYRTFTWDVRVSRVDVAAALLYLAILSAATILLYATGVARVVGPLLEPPVPCRP